MNAAFHPLWSADDSVYPERTPTEDPPEPCPHLPGTPEKLACLIRRHRLGYRLWHPADAGTGTAPVPPQGNGRQAGRPHRSALDGRTRSQCWQNEGGAYWDDLTRASEEDR